MTIAHDCVKDFRTVMFSDHNILEQSLEISYDFDKSTTPAGVRIEYTDPLTWEPAFVQDPPEGDDVETVQVLGLTSRNEALQHLTHHVRDGDGRVPAAVRGSLRR
jgi:hypothetical protein